MGIEMKEWFEELSIFIIALMPFAFVLALIWVFGGCAIVQPVVSGAGSAYAYTEFQSLDDRLTAIEGQRQ